MLQSQFIKSAWEQPAAVAATMSSSASPAAVIPAIAIPMSSSSTAASQPPPPYTNGSGLPANGKNSNDTREVLEDELEMYTRDVYRQSQAVQEQTRSWSRAEKRDVPSNLLDTAAALLAQTSSSPSKKRFFESSTATTTLAPWGDQPPTVIEVKRRVRGVQQGLDYVREEMNAQETAKTEAVAADAEGGYYTILGVPTTADAETLKKAFRRGMIKWHPDKVNAEERDLAQEKANMLQSAYNCLSNPWERFLYDWLGLKRYLYHVKVIQSFKNYMLTGFPIIKHPRKGYPRERVMWISPDWQFIQTARERVLEPEFDDLEMIKGMRITDVHDVVRGITTGVFERTGVPKKQSRYFSLIGSERTMDVECETKERCDFLFSRISMLVFDTQQNRKWAERFFEVEALTKARAAKAGGGGPPPNSPPQPTPPPAPFPTEA
jgi:curved DNA-binding protein CbpA